MAIEHQAIGPAGAGAQLRLEAAAHLGAAAIALAVAATLLGRAHGHGVAPALAAMALFAPVAAFVWLRVADWHPFRTFGWPNVVTTARASLACLFAGGLVLLIDGADPVLAWTLSGVATTALLLDGVDGYLARRLGLSSAFGARYDLEVDALLILALTLAAVLLGKAGPWVLLAGLARYLFLLAGLVWRPLARPLPASRLRKVVGATQVIVLSLIVTPLAASPYSAIAAAVALAALVASFAVDIARLTAGARGASSARKPGAAGEP